jgi:ATP-binding cassette, subfamily B (MDR/TAP), member 1
MWGLLYALLLEALYTPVMECNAAIDGVSLETCEETWSSKADSMQDKSFLLSLGFLGVVVCSLVGFTMLYWGFGLATERMNRRTRDAAFKSMIRQEVAWFDSQSSGALTSRISDDAALLHAYYGGPVRTLVSALSSVLVGVVLSFVFMWYVTSTGALYVLSDRGAQLTSFVFQALCFDGSRHLAIHGTSPRQVVCVCVLVQYL